VFPILSDPGQKHVALLRQSLCLFLLLHNDLLRRSNLAVQHLVIVDRCVVLLLHNLVASLLRLCSRAQLSLGLNKVFRRANRIHLSAYHVMLNRSTLKIILSLQVKQIELKFMVSCLHLQLLVLSDTGLQHATKLLGRGFLNLGWSRRRVFVRNSRVAVANGIQNSGRR
jgi:hypothetical protein